MATYEQELMSNLHKIDNLQERKREIEHELVETNDRLKQVIIENKDYAALTVNTAYLRRRLRRS